MKYAIQYIESDGTEHDRVTYGTDEPDAFDSKDLSKVVGILTDTLLMEGDQLIVEMVER